MIEQSTASFRDPSGFVFRRGRILFRQVNQIYQRDYDLLLASGLYDRLINKGWLIPHREVEEIPFVENICYRVLQPETIPFISYPYEWSFSQLKDAALLTLGIEKEALQSGMILKDASAYNIQFNQGKPILIDTLSFTRYVEGNPWVAYRQFCQHFLAPLALMSKVDLRLGKLLSLYIDGIPLDLCSTLLPFSTRLDIGLLTHIHLHAKSQQFVISQKEQKFTSGKKAAGMGKMGMIGLVENLEATIKRLKPRFLRRGWVDYYAHTNYTDETIDFKKQVVQRIVRSLSPQVVWDLGANNGFFSRAAAEAADCLVISADVDPESVEENYRQQRIEKNPDLLPLVIDLTNPSPAIGWSNQERDAFLKRGPADLAMALALIHHLVISNNVNLSMLAKTLSRLAQHLLIEFVPKEDSQVQKLLASREDIFENYHLEGFLQAFEAHFILKEKISIPGSVRVLFLYESKELR